MNMRWIVVAILAIGCAIATTRGASASSCTIDSATMSFGNYDVYAAVLAVSGTIGITCTGNTNPTATLAAGNSGTTADRDMTCPACTGIFAIDHLHYNLYTDALHTSVWGATGFPSVPADCKNASCAFTIFGRIPAAISGGTNDVAVGSYSDSMLITVTF